MDITDHLTKVFIRIDDLIFKALMIPFMMIMSGVFFKRPLKGFSSKENHPIQALGFDGSHVAFEKGIQMRASKRQGNHLGLCQIIDVRSERFKAAILVNDDVGGILEESGLAIGQVSSHLSGPVPVRVFGDSCDFNSAGSQTHDDENIGGDQAMSAPDFNGGEANGGDGIPVGL